LLLQLLHATQVTTRAQLEAITHLSPSTVSKGVRRLIDAGFAEEIGQIPSTGGRPTRRLALRPAAGCAIGAEFSTQRLRVVVTDLNAAVHCAYEAEAPALHADRICEALCGLIEQALEDVGREQVIGLGIAVPGVADTTQGRMVIYSDLDLFDYPLGDKVYARTGFFPLIYNRSTSAAMGEKWQGDSRGVQSLFYVALDSGISGGLIVKGGSYRGASPAIGEIGHCTVLPDGPICFCGNRGCLQTVASSGALAARARELIKAGQPTLLTSDVDGVLARIDALAVLRAAERNDALATAVLAEAADYIGIAVGTFINLFSPERVVLGGPLITACPQPWVDLIRAGIQRRTLSYTMQASQVVVGKLGDDSRSIGAAALAIQHWFATHSPVHYLDLTEIARHDVVRQSH
jgi:predicted NBD/HSP70 family sugar kinase